LDLVATDTSLGVGTAGSQGTGFRPHGTATVVLRETYLPICSRRLYRHARYL